MCIIIRHTESKTLLPFEFVLLLLLPFREAGMPPEQFELGTQKLEMRNQGGHISEQYFVVKSFEASVVSLETANFETFSAVGSEKLKFC